MTGLAHRGWSLNDYQQHMIHTLRPAGYTSVLAGIQHLAVSTTDKQAWQIIGYDKYLSGDQYKQAASFLKQHQEQPFFLSIGFFETHREFPAINNTSNDSKYCLPPSPLPDTPETRKDMARYKASVQELDRKIGVVLDALEHSSYADNTLVICTTDHGIAFPRMKCNLHDSGIGTMLIMRGPGGFTGGEVIDSMTSHLDIFPTLCDLLEIESPSWLRGQSLIPLVQKEASDLHRELFFEVNYHASYEPLRAIRTNRWKYIRRFDNYANPVLPNCDDGESKSVWLDHGWQDRPVPEESLFDLIFDPNEANNLADNTTSQAILKHMRSRLKQKMEETNDPLLNGDIHLPVGAVINHKHGLSPSEQTQTASHK